MAAALAGCCAKVGGRSRSPAVRCKVTVEAREPVRDLRGWAATRTIRFTDCCATRSTMLPRCRGIQAMRFGTCGRHDDTDEVGRGAAHRSADDPTCLSEGRVRMQWEARRFFSSCDMEHAVPRECLAALRRARHPNQPETPHVAMEEQVEAKPSAAAAAAPRRPVPVIVARACR